MTLNAYTLITTSDKEYQVISDINSFLEDVALGVIAPDKLLVNNEILQAHPEIKDLVSENVLVYPKPQQVQLEEHQQVQPEKPQQKSKLKKDESQKKKPSLFTRLFGKKSETVEVQLNIDTAVLERVQKDYSRGPEFKSYLVRHGYLTESQLQTIENKIKEYERFGHKKYLIQVAREEGYLSEDTAAHVLSFSVGQEIISKDIPSSQIPRLAKLNAQIINFTSDYIILDINETNHTLRVLKDLSVQPNYHLIDRWYPGYHMQESSVVEGVTALVISEILAYMSKVGGGTQ